MLRAIIIDDEQKGIDSLKLLIEKFIPELKVIAESTQPRSALDMVEDYKPEIVFLDINMPDMNGFELLGKLKWREFNLIFTTAHEEYALKAIKNNAIDYLLKPIDHEDLQLAVVRVRKQLEENRGGERYNYERLLSSIQMSHKQRVIINSKYGVESVDVGEIIHLESQSNYTKIFLSDTREILTTRTLKEFEGQLCERGNEFMRIHHSFIINLKKVVRYLKTEDLVVMDNNQKIPLAKSRRDAFYKWMDI